MIILFTTRSSRWKYDVTNQLVHREPLDQDPGHPPLGYDDEWFAGSLFSSISLGGTVGFMTAKYGVLWSGKVETLSVETAIV